MQRQSNIELLRIVSMLLILIVHIDGASLGLPQPMGDITSITTRDWWRLIVESISIIGVNCFVLISGYFGIRASWKGFLRFSSYCLFYSVAIYCIVAIGINNNWSWKGLSESFMFFTHTDLWFIPAYLGLYLIAPFLNKSTEALPFKQYSILLCAFIAFNIYAGWWWQGKFNPNGYTIIHLIMIYLIGRYIYRFLPRIKLMGLYAAFAWVMSTCLILLNSLCDTSLMAFAYNSPFIMFKSMHFSNAIINYCAASAFAVYLIHKNPLIWLPFTNWIKDMWETTTLPIFTLLIIAVTLGIFWASILIDQSRRYLMTRLKL